MKFTAESAKKVLWGFPGYPIGARIAFVLFFILFLVCYLSLFDLNRLWQEGMLLGDTADPRFNGSILEHWFQVFRGRQSWHSPGFYYPTPGVLGFSDGLVLYTPIYALARMAGADPYLALTQTQLALPIICYVALFIFFTKILHLDALGAGFLSLAGTLSENYFGYRFHPQNHTICLVPLALLLIGAAVQKPLSGRSQASRLVSGFLGGLVAGLLALTSFATFWLTGVLLGLFGLALASLAAVAIWTFRSQDIRAQVHQFACNAVADRGPLIAIALGLACGVVPALMVYLPAAANYPSAWREGSRRLVEWRFSLLDVRVASPDALLQYLARGLLPLWHGTAVVLALAVLVSVALARRVNGGVRLLATAALLSIVVALMAMYRFGRYSLWSVLELLPGGIAVSDPERFGFVINLASVVAMAAVAGWLIRQQGSRARLLLVALYGLTGLVAYDGWRRIGGAYQNLPHADYFAVVGAPYARSGECRSFFVGAEGAKDQLTRHGFLWPLLSLDAVYLSYRFELPTLNGYSGNSPREWDLSDPSCSGCYLNAVDHWIRLHRLEKVCVFEYSSRELKPYTPAAEPRPCPGVADAINLNASLSGTSAGLSVAGNGTLTATFETCSKRLSWKGGYSGLSGPATAVNFRSGQPGKNGRVVIPVTPNTSPFEGSAIVTGDQASELLAGRWYINVQTEAHKDGEISGQIRR
jgi:CHRD domain